MTDDAGDVRWALPTGTGGGLAAAVTLVGAATAAVGLAFDVGTALVGGTALAAAGLIALVLLSVQNAPAGEDPSPESGTDPDAGRPESERTDREEGSGASETTVD